MRASFAPVFLIVLLVIGLVTASDILTVPQYDQCQPSFQMSHLDSHICHSGHVLTSLAMAMTHRAPKTHFETQQSPQYSPNQLAAALMLKNVPLADIYSQTFKPLNMIPHLSSNIHYTLSFSPTDLTDEQVDQFCSHTHESPAVYLVDTPDSTIWVNHCYINPKTAQMVITAHHPRLGEQKFTWDEFKQISQTVHELYISHNDYQQQVFSSWSLSNVNNQLQNMLIPTHKLLDHVFTRQSISIYEKLGVEDEWVMPHTYFVSWKQGDYQDIMTTKTIAQVGCLMCSVAVGLRNRNIQLPGGITVDPSTWNTFIREHNGYVNDDFIHTTVDPVCEGRTDCHTWYNPEDGRHPKNDMTIEEVKKMLDVGKRHIVANVNGGRHFVPIVGYSKTNPSRFKTFDSAGGTHGREWFDHSEIVGYRLYDITGPFDKITENIKKTTISSKKPCGGL